MSSLSRRQALTRIAQAAGAASLASLLSPANLLFAAAAGAPQARRNDLPTGEENASMFRIGRNFLGQFFAPALSVAIVRDSKFVYERPWGMADTKQHVECSNTSLFRIASVTKPITSVAIFTLLEQGKLNLNDKVFGPSGILADDYGKTFRQYVTDVTVDHLLTHTSGGWPNDDTDPMFHNNSWDHKKLITESIATLPLTYVPGTHWAYSNFGYCILGRVIEKLTVQTYEQYIKDNILRRCDLTDMRIAGNTLEDRATNEVKYYDRTGRDPYGMNVARMDSHGGWIATPSDLTAFFVHIDGFKHTEQLLSDDTLRRMTSPTTANSHYAKGLFVNPQNNWWHGGSLPGTATISVRTHSDFCWSVFTNTQSKFGDMASALDRLPWHMVASVADWHP